MSSWLMHLGHLQVNWSYCRTSPQDEIVEIWGSLDHAPELDDFPSTLAHVRFLSGLSGCQQNRDRIT